MTKHPRIAGATMLAFAVIGCTDNGVGVPCDDDVDCAHGLVCGDGESGRFCVVPSERERQGEGEEGEGEGEVTTLGEACSSCGAFTTPVDLPADLVVFRGFHTADHSITLVANACTDMGNERTCQAVVVSLDLDTGTFGPRTNLLPAGKTQFYWYHRDDPPEVLLLRDGRHLITTGTGRVVPANDEDGIDQDLSPWFIVNAEGTITAIPDLPVQRESASAAVLQDGRVFYLMGRRLGYSGGPSNRAVFAWQPENGLWTTLADAPIELQYATVLPYSDGSAVLFGGLSLGGAGHNESFVWDPDLDFWHDASAGGMSCAPVEHANGTLECLAGSSLAVWQPADRAFDYLGFIPFYVGEPEQAARLGNELLLAADQTAGFGSQFGYALYDIDTRVFTPLVIPPPFRGRDKAVPLPDRVAIIGGFTDDRDHPAAIDVLIRTR